MLSRRRRTLEGRMRQAIRTARRYPAKTLRGAPMLASIAAVLLLLTTFALLMSRRPQPQDLDDRTVVRRSKGVHGQPAAPFRLLDPMSLGVGLDLPGPLNHPGCLHGLDDALRGLQYATTIEKDVGMTETPPDDPNMIVRLPAYDYDEVKGMVVLFQNAYVTGHESIVYDCSIVYRPGGCEEGPWNPYPTLADGPVSPIKGRVVLIAMFWAYRYFHWLVESFLRLAMVRDWLIANPDVRIMAYRPPGPDGLWDLYAMLGLDRSRFIDYDPRTVYHVEKLLVPTATAGGRLIPRAAVLVRDEFRLHLAKRFPQRVPSGRRPVRIVLQSRGNLARHIVNHNDLLAGLRRRFPNAVVDVYDSFVDSYERMVRLHYEADVLVGPHGAGLSNSIFMANGTSLFEIYMRVGMMGAADWFYPCFQIEARRLGLHYTMIRSETGHHGSPMTVDVEVTLDAITPAVRLQEDRIKQRRQG
ncbi:unnamed protein product (mitochondrion) [Plasmodiophora brassicae]|uniref:Glycosyltransferase 61 catalytic domain-containing protein n=1 Tax=Plasmodiophora brassicae TaxID=37360 RepID=A0A0G4J663_PLABS|nr:hypothetical protein PBRA_009230 [Plasmodiophora brassicae]SPR01507.1 unnamed protein product [Plasmodiophora brassicae]